MDLAFEYRYDQVQKGLGFRGSISCGPQIMMNQRSNEEETEPKSERERETEKERTMREAESEKCERLSLPVQSQATGESESRGTDQSREKDLGRIQNSVSHGCNFGVFKGQNT